MTNALDQVLPATYLLALRQGNEAIGVRYAAEVQADLFLARCAMTLPDKEMDGATLLALHGTSTLLDFASRQKGDAADIEIFKAAHRAAEARLQGFLDRAAEKPFARRLG